MIPIFWFFLAWLVLVSLFAILSLVTALVNFKYGIANTGFYVSLGLFLTVGFFVVLFVGSYALTVDWSQTISLLPNLSPSLEL